MLLTDPFWGESVEWTELANQKGGLFVEMEGASHPPLKTMLEKTGVALEARLLVRAGAMASQGDMPQKGVSDAQIKHEAKGTMASQGDMPLPVRTRALPDLQAPPQPVEDAPADMPLKDPAPASPGMEAIEGGGLESDLKAGLLQIKRRLLDLESQALQRPESTEVEAAKQAGEAKTNRERMLQLVDGLLLDIETFQLLSKLTNSFYTFLPVIWKGLREGEIAFKRGRSGAQGKSYYCLMNLDFEDLGKLTVVAMMQNRDVFVSFKTDHADFGSVLDKNISELKEMVRAQGFNLKGVNFQGSQEDHLAPFERLEAFDHIINIKI
jgi:hypothetical protein